MRKPKFQISFSRIISSLINEHMVYVFLIGVIIIAAFVSPDFFQTKNILNVLRQASALGILSVGQTVVVVAGGLDLSVAAVMQLSGVTVAEITKGQNELVWIAIPVSLALGLAIGFGNGWLVAKRKVQPFISTLFVGMLVTGFRLLVTQATPSGILPPFIRTMGSASTGPVPNAVILFALVAVLISFLLTKTTLGRAIFATGGNPRTAVLNGINADRTTIICYVVCGGLAALAGLVLVGYLGYADQEIGIGYDLDSIAAVAVGGAVLGGGRGRISGTVAGILLMTGLLNLVLLLRLPVAYKFLVRGVVILAAVAFYSANWEWLSGRIAAWKGFEPKIKKEV
jgi:ribose/xylose/arabinose/galactoside ABC-type transport system permease subunit